MRTHVDLSNIDNMDRFEKMIEQAKYLYDSNFFRNPSESKFVKQMIDNFQTRRDDGIPWNPSLKQYNWLHTLIN